MSVLVVVVVSFRISDVLVVIVGVLRRFLLLLTRNPYVSVAVVFQGS